jgi:predicted DNA-binding antitoxin AbrB/MazE fold protein
MALKAIQVRVHDGNLEPLEKLPLAEGSVVTVVVPFPDVVTAPVDRVELDTWNLGAMGPLTRDDIYEDAI